MLAERLPTLLPDLDHGAALEVTAIHSVAGTLPAGQPLITRPPFQAPHHTASRAALVGGGSGRLIQPGAASLAHRGVLFLDESPEFCGGVLDALRQPLEERRGHDRPLGRDRPLSRTVHDAARREPLPLRRPEGTRLRLRAIRTAPLPHPTVRPAARPRRPQVPAERGDPRRAPLRPRTRRIQRSRRRTAYSRPETAPEDRLADTPWRTNAEIPGREFRRRFAPVQRALATLDRPLADGRLSARGLDRVVRVAWTLTDLRGKEKPTADEVNEALSLWEGRT